ncbi:MAG: hypothetical protein K2X77_33620 [Candidatus Obscuribacterales bacterium]|nr:hypothetical protein [Candidatus Obscuribacterales bacterium]
MDKSELCAVGIAQLLLCVAPLLWSTSFFAGKVVSHFSSVGYSTPFTRETEDRIEGTFCFFTSLSPHIILAMIAGLGADLYILFWTGSILLSLLCFGWPLWSEYKVVFAVRKAKALARTRTA